MKYSRLYKSDAMRRLRTYVCGVRIINDRGMLLSNNCEVASYFIGEYFFIRRTNIVEPEQYISIFFGYQRRHKYNEKDGCMSPLLLVSAFWPILKMYRGLECIRLCAGSIKIDKVYSEVF